MVLDCAGSWIRDRPDRRRPTRISSSRRGHWEIDFNAGKTSAASISEDACGGTASWRRTLGSGSWTFDGGSGDDFVGLLVSQSVAAAGGREFDVLADSGSKITADGEHEGP